MKNQEKEKKTTRTHNVMTRKVKTARKKLRKQPYRRSQTLGKEDSDTVVLFIWWNIMWVGASVLRLGNSKRATECCLKWKMSGYFITHENNGKRLQRKFSLDNQFFGVECFGTWLDFSALTNTTKINCVRFLPINLRAYVLFQWEFSLGCWLFFLFCSAIFAGFTLRLVQRMWILHLFDKW